MNVLFEQLYESPPKVVVFGPGCSTVCAPASEATQSWNLTIVRTNNKAFTKKSIPGVEVVCLQNDRGAQLRPEIIPLRGTAFKLLRRIISYIKPRGFDYMGNSVLQF